MSRRYSLRRLIGTSVALSLVVAVLCCGSIASVWKAQNKQDTLKPYEFSLMRMGTLFRIILYDTDPGTAQKSALAAFERVEELEDIMSDYRDLSEVARLCRVAAGTPQAVSPELYFVLENSLRISQLSGGAFDVTIGPVVQLWREARRKKRLPDPAELKTARQLVGYANVALDPGARTVTLKLPNMRIDLGGIAKGYAADVALALLKTRGIRSALVDAGGDLAVGEAPPGKKGWRIVIRNPEPGRPNETSYPVLHDAGIATSGDAFQFIDVDGKHYSHIINPADGLGVKNSPSVTTIARNCMTADALATALSIMPVPDGLKLVDSIEGASAAIVRRTGEGFERFYSSGFPKSAADAQAPKTKPTVP